MFLPNHWPAYYQKAHGIEITTLDELKDMLKAIKEKGLAERDDSQAIKQASKGVFLAITK